MTDDAVASAVDRLMAQARDDLERLVAIPSVASEDRLPVPAGREAADWSTASTATWASTTSELLDADDGSVVVLGRTEGPAGAPRVLLYAHYDVQPAGDAAAWSSDPWTLTERDGRWYARGAADCKGNLVMHLTALRALRDVDGGWPVSLTVVCEGLGGDVDRRPGTAGGRGP